MKNFRYVVALVCLLVSVSSIQARAEETEGNTTRDYLNNFNAGIAVLLDEPRESELAQEAKEELVSKVAEIEPEEEIELSTLFMANVNNSVNVRVEPDEDSEKAGKLYKDCGGRILERGDEWTRIQSGDLVGWVHNDYILMDDAAEALAEEVGFKILTVKTDALRIRMEPDANSGVLGLVASGDELEVLDDSNPEWVQVDFEGDTGYLSAEYVDLSFAIDYGETMAAIAKREAEEAEAKRQALLHAQQAKVDADGDDLRLLAALIQCEAGTIDYQGQLAVGAVVMNRVRSGAYPNTIYGVIYASGQFTPALNGKVARVYNNKVYDSCMQAAQEAINGGTNVGTATHFRRDNGTREGVRYGGQVFW